MQQAGCASQTAAHMRQGKAGLRAVGVRLLLHPAGRFLGEPPRVSCWCWASPAAGTLTRAQPMDPSCTSSSSEGWHEPRCGSVVRASLAVLQRTITTPPGHSCPLCSQQCPDSQARTFLMHHSQHSRALSNILQVAQH